MQFPIEFLMGLDWAKSKLFVPHGGRNSNLSADWCIHEEIIVNPWIYLSQLAYSLKQHYEFSFQPLDWWHGDEDKVCMR